MGERWRMKNGASIEFGGKPGPDYLSSSTRWLLPGDVPTVWRPRNPDPAAAFRECMAALQEQADVIKASLCPCGELACACPRRPC